MGPAANDAVLGGVSVERMDAAGALGTSRRRYMAVGVFGVLCRVGCEAITEVFDELDRDGVVCNTECVVFCGL